MARGVGGVAARAIGFTIMQPFFSHHPCQIGKSIRVMSDEMTGQSVGLLV